MVVKGSGFFFFYVEVEFGGNYYMIVNRGQCFFDKFFIEMGVVDFGSIKECDILFEGCLDK